MGSVPTPALNYPVELYYPLPTYMSCFVPTCVLTEHLFRLKRDTSRDFRFLFTIFHQYSDAVLSNLTSVRLGCFLQSINFNYDWQQIFFPK